MVLRWRRCHWHDQHRAAVESAERERPAFDGASSSDLAQQFYQRYARGDSVESFNSTLMRSLPDTISRRLTRLNVSTASFRQLPGLLQRAVVWDSGFVLDAESSSVFVQVWTSQGRSMADIVVFRQEISTESSDSTAAGSSQCPLTQCTQPNSTSSNTTSSYKTSECTCEILTSVSKCAVAADAELGGIEDTQSLLWASGADPNAIPIPRIAEHRCQAGSSSNSNTTGSTRVCSIRTSSSETRTGCSSTQFDSLVIPCVRMSALNSTARARMKEPKPSAWVDAWLTAAAQVIEAQAPSTNASTPSPSSSSGSESSSSFKIVWLIPIVMGSLFAIALLGFFAIRYTGPQHRLNSNRGVTTNSSIDVSALLSPRSKGYE